jgi:hypothetical protein
VTLRSALPHETILKLAGIVHEGVCLAHDEDMDEEYHAECVSEDADVVKELLDVLDHEGVSYSRFFIPIRGKATQYEKGPL